MQKAQYQRMVFKEIDLKPDSPLVIREDNKASISFSKTPDEHRRTKHVHIFKFSQFSYGKNDRMVYGWAWRY